MACGVTGDMLSHRERITCHGGNPGEHPGESGRGWVMSTVMRRQLLVHWAPSLSCCPGDTLSRHAGADTRAEPVSKTWVPRWRAPMPRGCDLRTNPRARYDAACVRPEGAGKYCV